MIKSILYICLFTILLSTLFAQSSFYCKVIGIKDGDTIEILTADKKTIIIRLNGIDAPEYLLNNGLIFKYGVPKSKSWNYFMNNILNIRLLLF